MLLPFQGVGEVKHLTRGDTPGFMMYKGFQPFLVSMR